MAVNCAKTIGIRRKRVVIIGAGASGLMAAGSVSNCDVTVLERNEKVGKKLYISGKGRCNVTNDCTSEEFFGHVTSNGKFLYSCYHGFTAQDARSLLESLGVPTKVERGNRVFPCSEKSSDVIRALYERATQNGSRFVFNERVIKIVNQDGTFVVHTECGEYPCDNVLIATGGKSYPATGSTGDGYALAERFGHKIIEPTPSLVPFVLKADVSRLAGLTLKNVSATIEASGKKLSQFGELLFTHTGVSGPIVLKLSALVNRLSPPMKLYIDMKPVLDDSTLDKRITADFAENPNRQLKNSLDRLLPKAMIPEVLRQSGLEPEKKVNILTREQRQKLLYSVKHLCYDIERTESFAEAIVTAGGVDVREVNPKTMESKLVKGLYFAGEVLDVDALTGGFNIQIALSTAHAAAVAIGQGE